MRDVRIGIVMNGVTGRMGARQHLARSIVPIRDEGGTPISGRGRIIPEPVLVGRDPERVRAVAEANGIERWSTDLDACLSDADNLIYFDAVRTDGRPANIRRALAAGKHVYCEKPTAGDLETAIDLARLADEAGVRHGVVQDKLFLPGMLKLRYLLDSGFFGRVLSVEGDFGYWVFEGDREPAQRPSWNYRREDGGGIIVDMLPHFRYLLDNLFGRVQSISCFGATHIPERVDEGGLRYDATADDAAYATFELEGGIVARIDSSWATRVYRDDLFVLQVDGTKGSAVAGLRSCRAQPRVATPTYAWDPDAEHVVDYRAPWVEVEGPKVPSNAFRHEWELFLRAVVEDTPFRYDLWEGAKGVQLAELGLRSWHERRWVDVPAIGVEVPA